MKQLIHWPAILPSINATLYSPLWAMSPQLNGPEVVARTPWSVAGTLSNLKVVRVDAPGSGVTVNYTVFKNGSATALTVAIAHPATSATDTSNTVTLAAGDTVSLRATNTGGTPAFSHANFSLEFDSGDNFQNSYATSFSTMFQNTAVARYASLCFGRGKSFANNEQTDDPDDYLEEDLFPIAGTLTRFDFHHTSGSPFDAIPASNSVEFCIVHNDIVQDGANGTVDTRTTLTDAITTATWTGTLTIAAGDRLSMRLTPTAGMVSGANDYAFAWSYRFNSTTAHRFWLASSAFFADTASTYYGSVAGLEGSSNTENIDDGQGSSTATFYMLSLHTNTDGGSIPFSASGRLNGATPADAPEHTFSSDLFVATFTSNFQMVAVFSAVSPGSGDFITITSSDTWAIRLLASTEIKGSAVFGVNTTVRATRAVAFGLDGNTNELISAGKMKVFGDFEVTGSVTMAGATVSVTSTELSAVSAQAASAISNLRSAHNALSNVVSNIISAGGGGVSVTSNELSAVSAQAASAISQSHSALSQAISVVSAAVASVNTGLSAVSARSVGGVSTHGLQSVINALSNRISAVVGGSGSVTSNEVSAVSAQAASAINVLSNVVSALSAAHTSLVNRVSANSATGGSGSVTSNELSAVSAQAASAINALSNVVSAIVVGPGDSYVVAAADFVVSNTAVLQNDPSLLFSLTTSATYTFETVLLLNAANTTNDFRFGFTLPAGATAWWGNESGGTNPWTSFTGAVGVPTTLLSAGQAISVGGNGAAGMFPGIFKGIVITAGTPGTFQWQMAQNTASATSDNTRRPASHIRYRKIA